MAGRDGQGIYGRGSLHSLAATRRRAVTSVRSRTENACGCAARRSHPDPETWSLAKCRSSFLTDRDRVIFRSEEHTSELQSLMRSSYAVFCLKKKNKIT